MIYSGPQPATLVVIAVMIIVPSLIGAVSRRAGRGYAVLSGSETTVENCTFTYNTSARASPEQTEAETIGQLTSGEDFRCHGCSYEGPGMGDADYHECDD